MNKITQDQKKKQTWNEKIWVTVDLQNAMFQIMDDTSAAWKKSGFIYFIYF